MLSLVRGAPVPTDPRVAELGFPLTTVRDYARRVSALPVGAG
ncbi:MULTISPECIES: hypothetical protein [Deinococcus]|jgi:hypothetical protein|uniref:Uncharacterized protein n=1 Tax=Deinococcus enclensis TaxID=1049582 RepID=A0ABT9MGM7_9DEIO|nr:MULTISPECIES: hypothetical protein [Deinococcus]MDP9765755.1 hypothetical protein [Deinococcus enclensis]